MKKTAITLVVSLVMALVIHLPSMTLAKELELGEGVVVTAEVVAIDYQDRSLALLGPAGNVITLEVGPEARNFDKIMIGDMVKAQYYESVALYLGKKGEKPTAGSGTVAARSAKGDMPAGAVVEVVDVSAEIKALDKKKRTVTLAMPDGRQVTTKVDESVTAFDTLKVGDSIHARYTEAMAISVERN